METGVETSGERVVCISGGTAGIGAGLVEAFLRAGDRVFTFGRSPERVERLKTLHAGVGARLTALPGDVTDDGFRSALVARIAGEAGRLDVLVNNAAVLCGFGDLDETPEEWRVTLETNLIAPFALIRAFAPLLARSAAPSVVNVSSACAGHPFDTCTSTGYSVSKAGLDLMTRRLARALAPRGIRVNALAPGVVETEMWRGEAERMAETVARRHVLGHRSVTVEEVASAALFLSSPAASSVTGTILNVDAGYTLG